MNKGEYLSQIALIRKYALKAVKHYAIKEPQIRLIRHGQNTVFKVTSNNGQSYILRVHFSDSSHIDRESYLEEMEALAIVSKNKNITVPKPIRSTEGEWVVNVELNNKNVLCDLQTWVVGRHLWQGAREIHIQKIGKAMAEIQKSLKDFECYHRPTWELEGLLDPYHSRFIGIADMNDLSATEKSLLLAHNELLFVEVKQYQKAHPERMGIIHGDLHLNNCLFSKEEISVIDFDDFGYGLYDYDFMALWDNLPKLTKNKAKLKAFQQALLEGYSTITPLNQANIDILPIFQKVRQLVVLKYLYMNRNNPRLLPWYDNVKDAILKCLAI